MTIEPSLIISFVALLLSMFSVYQQWLKPHHPKIAFLINPDETHRSVLRPYRGLPSKYQQAYPEYPEKHSGYAILHLPFGNAGNEAGLVKVISVDIQNSPGWSEGDKIKASFYNHCIVPSRGVVLHPVVLRNIPHLNEEQMVQAIVKIEWGEPGSKTGAFMCRDSQEHALQILVVPSGDIKAE